MPDSARWLLDNLYLARRAAREVSLTFASAGQLRASGDRALIACVCGKLLASGDGEAEEERIGVFLDAFQERTVLTRRELSLTAAGLELAALSNLAEIYERPSPEVRRCAGLFTSLRRLGSLELRDTLEGVDRVDRLLRRDPAGIYPRMDRRSREDYRNDLARLARETGRSETDTARQILSRAVAAGSSPENHVGYYIHEQPSGRQSRRPAGVLLAGAELLLPLALAGILSALLRSPWAGLLSLPGLIPGAKTALNRGVLAAVPPRQLPRMDLRKGVPEEGKTLCVISALLTGPGAAASAAKRLEELKASEGAGENLNFGLLCDLPESDRLRTAADDELLARAAETIEDLNRRYAGGFFLFCRERTADGQGKHFLPWERKRGALVHLCRFLAGRGSDLQLRAGERAALRGTRYVLTLDADTRP